MQQEIITSRNNPKIKFAAALSDKKFRTENGVVAFEGFKLLDEFLLNASQEEIEDLENRLSHIKSEMIKKNIIISDIRPGNILVLKNRQGTIVRIIFLDGYGSPEFIPLPMYCPFFGKLKIERQWKKFNRHYNNAKSKRQSTI